MGMSVQSLSIVVPGGCPNNCFFCVSKMNREDKLYTNQIEKNKRFRDLYKEDFQTRMEFARDNGCNTVILTGDGEPLMNSRFLEMFADMNKSLKPSPFKWIEIQTSGVLLDDEYLRYLRNTIRVSTISLSMSDMFDSKGNAEYNRTVPGKEIDIDWLCSEIKRYDFNLRLSLNMTDKYNNKSPIEIIERASKLGADQITFRKLYKSNETDSEQNLWIDNHAVNESKFNEIDLYVKEHGRPLGVLPFGSIKYSINHISTVIDNDCMSREVKDTYKYLILRPNCKLYSHWDDAGSIIF